MLGFPAVVAVDVAAHIILVSLDDLMTKRGCNVGHRAAAVRRRRCAAGAHSGRGVRSERNPVLRCATMPMPAIALVSRADCDGPARSTPPLGLASRRSSRSRPNPSRSPVRQLLRQLIERILDVRRTSSSPHRAWRDRRDPSSFALSSSCIGVSAMARASAASACGSLIDWRFLSVLSSAASAGVPTAACPSRSPPANPRDPAASSAGTPFDAQTGAPCGPRPSKACQDVAAVRGAVGEMQREPGAPRNHHAGGNAGATPHGPVDSAGRNRWIRGGWPRAPDGNRAHGSAVPCDANQAALRSSPPSCDLVVDGAAA